MKRSLALLISLGISVHSVRAQPQTPADKALEKEILHYHFPKLTRTAIGVTRAGASIPALVSPEDFDLEHDRTRVLLIGGLDGSRESVNATLSALEWIHEEFSATALRKEFLVSAVPCANPEGFLNGTSSNGVGGDPSIGYPPNPKAYNDPKNPEAQYLWRWIGMFAPDFVVDLRGGGPHRLRSAGGASEHVRKIAAAHDLSDNELAAALGAKTASGVGHIPAIRIECGGRAGADLLRDLLRRIEQANGDMPSPARVELRNRVARSPLRVARQLEKRYGHDLNLVAYQPALSLVARARLDELTGERGHLADVLKIVEPYASGEKPSFGKRVYGSHVAGHLVFGELARATEDKRFVALVKAAADQGFDEQGRPKEAMPYHNEMSDAVFMSCPILAQAGVLTGDRKYFDMCLRHLRFMRKHCRREDGIYRHSPLDEAAWGRGNGFPALGLAWTLSWLPEDFAGRPEILAAYREHMGALARLQDPNGAWHQVVDHPESYRELTSTCMITFAMARGIRNNWLNPAGFEPVIKRAWTAIKTRVAADGNLVDVCTGTGKQKDLRSYYDRTAILGPDERGGAMAFMVAVEMAALEKGRSQR